MALAGRHSSKIMSNNIYKLISFTVYYFSYLTKNELTKVFVCTKTKRNGAFLFFYRLCKYKNGVRYHASIEIEAINLLHEEDAVNMVVFNDF